MVKKKEVMRTVQLHDYLNLHEWNALFNANKNLYTCDCGRIGRKSFDDSGEPIVRFQTAFASDIKLVNKVVGTQMRK